MFDLNFLTTSMKQYPVRAANQDDAGSQVSSSDDEEAQLKQYVINGPICVGQKTTPVVTQEVVDDDEVDLPKDIAKKPQDVEPEQALQDEHQRLMAQELTAKSANEGYKKVNEAERRKTTSKSTQTKANNTSSLKTAKPTYVFQSTPNTLLQSAASSYTNFLNMEDVPEDAYHGMPDLTNTDEELDDEGIFGDTSFDVEMGVEADIQNMEVGLKLFKKR